MPSAEAILTRLAEVEAEGQLLRSQLSCVQKVRSPERPQRRTVLVPNVPNTKSPRETHDMVTGWLKKPAQKTTHSPLLDLFTQYERYRVVFDNIYRRLEIKDVLAISRTCRTLSPFYMNMLPCRWNINRRLARFVNDPKEFRSQLGQADALISGTFALLFFAQLYWLDSGLDIYVRQGSKADTLIRYIGEDKNYEFDHSYGWSDDDQHRTLTKVLIFRRTVPPGSPQIRFHLTRTLPLHSILTDCAFSTAHVNVISWNKAYCMFPNVTFLDRRMYFLHNPDEALGQILSKYSALGWRTSEWVDYDQTKGCNKPGIRQTFRTIGDSSSWTIPLNLHKIRTPSTPDSILESCTFQIFPDSGPRRSQLAVKGLKTFSIGAQPFSCCMLKHIYTFHTPDVSWTRFLRENLSRMIMLEILKTGDADLIAQTKQQDFMPDDLKCCPLLRIKPRLQRPDGWEYVDHMIPTWLEEWKTARKGRTASIDLTPQPLAVKKQPQITIPKLNLSSPRPLPLPRATSMTTSKLPFKMTPIPPLGSRSDKFPLSSRAPTSPLKRPPRSTSISHMTSSQPLTTTKLPILDPPPARRVVSAQPQPSKPESMLSPKPSESLPFRNPSKPSLSHTPHHITKIPAFNSTRQPSTLSSSATFPQQIKPTSTHKGDYFSLGHRRSKAHVPPMLNLSSKVGDGPLVPDLLTPPHDTPSSAKRLPLGFPGLPWSGKGRAAVKANALVVEKMIPGEMNWI